MSASDYTTVKRKLLLYTQSNKKNTNNTSLDEGLQSKGTRYFSSQEALLGSKQVRRYEACFQTKNKPLYDNLQNKCNVKIEGDGVSIYALQTY